ncbi:MAG: hypothetical protein JZU64_15430 [Rhodoferax sp.]|nr:hypothetical protein [Rhodoferax sp.]
MKNIRRRFLIVFYVTDNLLLALLTLGECQIGETISSVVWELEFDNKLLGRILRPCIDRLLWFDKDHCFNAWRTYQKMMKANL